MVLFINEGRLKQEIARLSGAVCAEMWILFQSVMMTNEPRRKAKMSIFQLTYVPTILWPLAVGTE